MDVCTNKDGDHSGHFVIKKNISIEFEESVSKTPKNLAVFSKGGSLEIKANARDNACHWSLSNEICLAPGGNDSLIFRVTYEKKGQRGFFKSRLGKDKTVEITLAHDIVTQELKEKNETEIKVSEASCTVLLVVAKGDISSVVVDDAVDDLKPVLPESFQDIIAACNSDAFMQDIGHLSGILEKIPVTEDALNAIEMAINKIGEAHPFAKAVLTALSIPYSLLKNESKFKQNVKDLAETMHFTCKCVVDVRYHTKIASAKDQLTSIMETLRNAARYVNEYVRKGKLGQIIGAQFPAELEGYSESLIDQKNRFQMAMIIQIARDVDMVASMTMDGFLRNHLRPAQDGEPSPTCLDGTRTKILEEMRYWVRDHGSEKNILWLQGPPGAGKSTIATTIAKELAKSTPFCVMFSCRRDVPDLRDPRKIWPTLAFNLSRVHDGIKAALMVTLNERKGDLRVDSVIEQFGKLIRSPLDTDRKEKHFLSRKPAYPVVVIDGLDECYSADDDNWDSLLDSLASWSELCAAGLVKLVVTSRHRDDLSSKLDGLNYLVRLTTGDDVTADSKADVGVFFKSKFAGIRTKPILKLREFQPNWPGDEAINKMTECAAGLFIWADMVIRYIAPRTGGSDPAERLQAVLVDIETGVGIDGATRVDRLYARVVFEALQRSTGVERSRAKSALAIIVLAKEPLGMDDIVELLSTDKHDARNPTNSTLETLSAIIPTHDLDNKLRVCHKTVSDFLLSSSRSEAAIKHILEQWNRQRPDDQVSDPHSFVINAKKEERGLALACMCLLHRKFSTNMSSVAQLHTQSLDYACNHWLEHLEGVGMVRIPGLKHLANAMKPALRSVQQYYDEVSIMGTHEVALLEHLRDVSKFALRCMDYEQTEVEIFQREISEHTKNLDIVRGNFQIAMVERSASESSDLFLRRRLQPSDQTVLDSPCLQGTRTRILQFAKNWLADASQPNILWIVGGPGAGKSAIATTLVREFSKGVGRVCAKVFAKRDFEDRRDPMHVWRTLAYDMAGLHVGFKGSIMEALWEESRQTKNAAERQRIIVEKLEEQQCLSIIFVLDALDECFTEDNEEWRALLWTLSTCAKLPFKLVITSRDIPEIRKVLEGISSCINLKPQSDDMKEEARADVEMFFRTRFEGIPKGSGDARSYWNQADVIHELIGNADSFIWAKMIVELVKLKPHSRLGDILNHNNAGNSMNWKVDALYAKVLFDVLGPLPEKERELFRTVLAFVVLAKTPLRKGALVELVRALPNFLSKDEKQVVNIVKEFSAVISIGSDGLLRIPHKSFADFLLDRDHNRSLSAMEQLLPAGSDPRSFIVNRKEDSANITIACLRIMSDTLEFNMCRIKTSHILNDDIPGLEARISENIKPSLIYACRFWGEHLNDCSHDDRQFRGQFERLLGNLLHENLLSWLEVLSLTKAVPSARRSLRIAEMVLKGYNNEFANVAEDARLFVGAFEAPIAAAGSHIYLSALPFCPSGSRIARTYGPRYMNVLSVVKGPRKALGPDAHTKGVNGIAFFPDGRKLASGSEDKTLRVWDAKTGEALSAPFTGHNNRVSSVAVSPNGTQIASGGSEVDLRIWDSNSGCNTGACPLGSINARSHSIYSVAFLPDGSRIVTCSEDKTVKVWNVATGDLCLGPLTGHTGDVNSVAFSIDGTVIASGSNDKTIRIWDARTGEPRGQPLTGHNDFVWCIAFSADGRHLASGSEDRTIRLWDVQQGFLPTCSITVEDPVTSFSFSPNSNCLVSGSDNGVLCFWIVRSGMIKQIGDKFYGHGNLGGNTRNCMRSVAFAPDGQSVASCGDDGSIRISRVPSSSVLPPTTTMVREGYPSSADLTSESLDSRGLPVLGDHSFIDKNGWMRSSNGAGVLFWVPEENRNGVWMPQNIAVIHCNVTKFDFRRFVHGEDWMLCRTSTDTEVV